MTISAQNIKVTVTGNGSQTTFSYNFLVPSKNVADLFLTDLTTGLVTLLPSASWSLTGAGNPSGGTFTYPVSGPTPPISAQQTLTLVRSVPNTQPTNLGNQGAYHPRAVEGALDWIVMQIQQFRDETSRAIRLPLSEQGINPLLPAGLRKNTIVAFDGNGGPILIPIQPDLNTTVIAQGSTTARTLTERFAEYVNVLDFGAVPDWNGTSGTDNTAAFNLAFAYAAATKRVAIVPYGDFYCANPVTLPGDALGLRMDGQMFSPGGFVALTLGDAGAARNQNKVYGPIRVLRTTQSNWSTEADIGVRVWNADNCVCVFERVEKFCINVQLASDQRGVEDSDMHYGRIIDGKIGVDMRCFNPGPNSYVNSIRHFGGHFACSSSSNPGVNRFGFRFSREPGGYDLHNAHTFYGPAFELQTVGGHLAIPFLCEVNGRGIYAHDIRMEACSPHPAWHTQAMNDCRYDVLFTGTFGPFMSVLYTGASRASGTVMPFSLTGAAVASPRLIIGNENVRQSAYRDVHQAAGGVGFDKMGIMSSNPSGSPTTLNTLVFGGASLFTLNAETVGVPTSRLIGYVLDFDAAPTQYGIAKEVFVAAEGSSITISAVQFNSSETVLDDTKPLMFSNANAVWSGAPSYWWRANVPVDQLSGGYPFFYWQRITFHPDCRFAVIGISGSGSGGTLKALRLFCSPLLAPQVLYGATGGPRDWGERELTAEADWTVPSLGAGATATFDITVPGLRGGDLLTAGFAKDSGFQNGGVVFHAVQGGTASTNQARVTAQNISGGTINVGSGRLFVRAVRPRI